MQDHLRSIFHNLLILVWCMSELFKIEKKKGDRKILMKSRMSCQSNSNRCLNAQAHTTFAIDGKIKKEKHHIAT